ncbi:DEKNAAC105536 [Brettanomyces naardenensis]|uniref:DEKNAAC105536 n=1 Tax=Brettanomyces naardenensis TaxID=13370 RepID=A0A448YU18_BRENA|nr:DEKNAAC105536 [Brettanomyces naardenensis]
MNIPDKSIQQLRPTIIYCLDHDLLPTAEFTAERLLAQDPNNSDSTFLYALTLYKSHRHKAAYNAAAHFCTSHVGCSYIFAKACLQLDQEPDGISSLTKTLPMWTGLTSEKALRYEPDNIACYMLLAKLYSVVGDTKRSALNYAQVLKLNPYIFEAFEQLCKLGAKVKVNSLYKSNNPMGDIQNTLFHTADMPSRKASRTSTGDAAPSVASTGYPAQKRQSSMTRTNLFKTPVAKSKSLGRIPDSVSSPDDRQPGASSSYLPTNFMITPRATHTTHIGPDSSSKWHSSDSGPRKKGRSAASSITSRLLNHSLSTLTGSGTGSGNGSVERQSTASNSSGHNGLSSPTESREVPNISGVGVKRLITSTFGSSSQADKYTTDDKVDNLLKNMNDEYLASIYSKAAKGFRAMCSYDCFRAIRIFDSLPDNERRTPWVLAKLGRLHFEIVNYEEAEKYFLELRKLDRTRVEDMEYYSTLLWHLHKEIDLSFLSHELYEVDKRAPQAWIAVGNLYSLKREPDEAIKCFQKAIKLDTKFVYAYTLEGHEYLANDAFENAMECFRHAIVLDRRHYNAFYGIGMAYLKLGDFRKAEFHFRKAAEINPVNVILICCVGMVLEKLGKREQALRQYVFASKLQPLSMLALFKKAQALFSMKQYESALNDFQKLEDMAPDEASVHFLLGKLYKFYGRKNEAIKQFTIALNLDPKGSHLIKEALENLQEG